jgi:hypothetical protein
MALASHIGNTERLVSETVLPKFRHFVWPRMTEHAEIRAHVMLSITLTLKEANVSSGIYADTREFLACETGAT